MIPTRFRLYWQKYKTSLVYTALLSLAAAGFWALAAAVTARVVNAVFLEGRNFMETAPSILVLFLCLCCSQLISYWQNIRQDKLAARVITTVRHQLHTAGLRKTAADNDTTLLQLSCDACELLAEDFRSILPLLLGLIISLPFYLLLFAFTDYLSALICLATLPIAPLLLYLLSGITKKRSAAAWENMQSLTQGFYELLQALPLLKLFAREQAHRESARQLISNFAAAALGALRLAFLSTFVLELITTLSIALVAVVIGLRLLEGRLAFSTAFFILLLLPEFYRPLRQSGAVFHTLMNVNTAAAEIETYLAAADAPPALSGHKASLQVPPAIRLANITFTYPERHSPTLQNLNLTFPAGQITLLTGNSGCGKSTLLDILACLQPPDSGTIYLNDQCLLTMHPDSQQKLIAYAPQTPHLYQGSLQENLLLLQQAPPERCHQALRLAQLTEWFSTLPQGLDTPLGAGGQPLSQGQLKRLGLARLILQNSPIMLLDEPTSGLDRQLEEKIIRTLSVLAKQRTLIISSHHPALFELADNIIDLNDYLPKEA